MMKPPLVSVLMTSYNSEKYISESIESVLNQSFLDFELIIIDDCSLDNTFSIVLEYAMKSNKIRVYQNSINLGQFENRNKAISFAKGSFIKFLDSDDLIAPNGLEIMLNALLNFPNAVLGVPKYDKKILTPKSLSSHESILFHFTKSNHLCVGPSGAIYKLSVIKEFGGFEPKFGILADTLFNLKIACFGETILFQQNLFYWRRHIGQVTIGQNDKLKMMVERIQIIEEILNFDKIPLTILEIEKIRLNFKKIYIIHFIRLALAFNLKSAKKIRKILNLKITDLLLFVKRCSLF